MDEPANRHLWMINHHATHPLQAGGTRHYNIARELLNHGWQSTIIAASPDSQPFLRRVRRESVEGVEFVWIPNRGYASNGMDRKLSYVFFTGRALGPGIRSTSSKPDVVLGSSVHLLAAYAGYKLARRHSVPFVYEVRDIWPETLIAFGALSANSRMAARMLALDAKLARAADLVLSPLPGLGNYLVEQHGVSANKFHWLPNGVRIADVPRYPLREPDGTLRLLYLGAMGHGNSLGLLMDAMAIVHQSGARNVRLDLYGKGPLRSELWSGVQRRGLDEIITFHDPLPARDMPELMSRHDALMWMAADLPQLWKYGMSPNKRALYLSSGLPVISAADISYDPIRENDLGYVCAPDDPAVLAETILAVRDADPQDRRDKGDRARQYCEEHLSFETNAARFAARLDSLVEQRGR